MVNILESDLSGSLGTFLLMSLKALPGDKVVQVNGLTNEQTTVNELLKGALNVACAIRGLGLKSNDVVAVVANYSTNSISSVLGTLLQGVIVYPMDPTLKQLELEQMFRHARPSLVFVMSRTAVATGRALKALGSKAPVVLLDEDNGPSVRHEIQASAFSEFVTSTNHDDFESPPIPKPEEAIALVVPSSGTTGLPKGVAVTHKTALFQFTLWEHLPFFTDGSPMLQLTPLFWVSGFQILLFSIAFGYVRIYLAMVTSEYVIKAINKYKPQWTMFAPVFLSWTINHPDFDKFDLSSMKHILVGGSVLPPSTIQLVKEKWPTTGLHQAYGASEMYGLITKPFYEGDIHSAGIPSDHVRVKIVDIKSGEEVETGKEGEILIKSENSLMKCYLNDEESTKRAIDLDGFFHTGDVGFFDEKNYLYITSRIKELMKVKNHQVSPYELEEVIRTIPGVADVAVVGVPHEIDQNHPRALVVKATSSNITKKEIIDIVADKLSETKQLFGGVQFMDHIPRGSTGKLKRDELLSLVKSDD